MTGFDEVIHAPHRLRITARLARVDSMEFGALRDDLQVADSVLSKQLKVLAEAGYVALEKPTGRGRVKTWAKLTPAGRRAFDSHLAALQSLVSEEGTRSPAARQPESARDHR